MPEVEVVVVQVLHLVVAQFVGLISRHLGDLDVVRAMVLSTVRGGERNLWCGRRTLISPRVAKGGNHEVCYSRLLPASRMNDDNAKADVIGTPFGFVT